MSKKKPSLVMSKKERLVKAKEELSAEREITQIDKQKSAQLSMTRTSLTLEAGLLIAVQELALKRKKIGQKPNTVSGIMREALVDTVINSKLKPHKT